MSNNPARPAHIYSRAMVAIVIQYDRLLQRYARRITGDEILAALIVLEAFRCYEEKQQSLTGTELRKALQAETLRICRLQTKYQQQETEQHSTTCK